MTEADVEDLFDAAIIDALLNNNTIDSYIGNLEIASSLLLSVGYTDYGFYCVRRLHCLGKLGFLEMNTVGGHFNAVKTLCDLAPKVRIAFEQGVFQSGRELFNPTPKQAALLRMWDITTHEVIKD